MTDIEKFCAKYNVPVEAFAPRPTTAVTDEPPHPTTEERISDLEAAMEVLLTGVTE